MTADATFEVHDAVEWSGIGARADRTFYGVVTCEDVPGWRGWTEVRADATGACHLMKTALLRQRVTATANAPGASLAPGTPPRWEVRKRQLFFGWAWCVSLGDELIGWWSVDDADAALLARFAAHRWADQHARVNADLPVRSS